MTKPARFLVRMLLFLLAVAAVAAALHEPLGEAFRANMVLNGLIIFVFLFGALLNLRQVGRLGPEVSWIERFRKGQIDADDPTQQPRLLGPMASMLAGHKERGRLTLSAGAMRSLLDSIGSRLDEARELSRYFTGLCIFLGLLGTFWGLMETVGSVGDVIRSLTLGGEDMNQVFDRLKRGLETPLQGMSTAFSSSLFGLSGSLILGFLDLQANRAQNTFYNDLEEWLSRQTRLSSGAGLGGDGEQGVPAYIQALLEQTAESLQDLQRTIGRGEESRIAANTYLRDLADSLATLTEQMRLEQSILLRLAEHQAELKPILTRLADLPKSGGFGAEDGSRGLLRSIDATLQRLAEEASQGRETSVREIRSEIKLLARTIAALAEDSSN